MGVGKSTFGNLLASFLNKPFIDIDEEIKAATNMKITEIFQNYGEEYFRTLESKICKEISMLKGYVVSTGGGVIKNEENFNNLKKSCTLIYLEASPLKIYYNIKDDFTRPLLNNCENKLLKIEELLSQRIPLYKKFCDFSIKVELPKIEENFDLILKNLGLK